MGDFEWAMAFAFNSFFEENGIEAIAYRLKQSRFASQVMDILVDSRYPEYYLAIECKSLDARNTRSIYFSQHFNSCGGIHQLDRETEFIRRSGRNGILAVELRRGTGKARAAHLVPWSEILRPFQEGEPGMKVGEIESFPALPRIGGAYQVTHEEVASVFSYAPPSGRIEDLDLADIELDLG
jgi:hypothetical protein